MKASVLLPGFCLLLSFQEPHQTSERMMSIAESEHEIVMLLIKKKSYEKALAECARLFAIELPTREQDRFLISARTISMELRRQGQPHFALQVVDVAIKAVDSKEVLAGLYKEKAFIHKVMGQEEEAMELFKKAIELEEPGS